LRDGLYRLCEGYLNGALDEDQYQILTRRYQKYMVALLGIEQLTGVVRAPTVAINTQGSAEVAKSLSEMRNELTSIDAEIKKQEAIEGSTTATDDDKKAAKTSIENLKKDRDAVDEAIKSTRGLLAGGRSSVVIENKAASPAQSDAVLVAVTEAVKQIVTNVTNTDDFGQLCFSHLSRKPDDSLTRICELKLQQVVTAQQALLKVLNLEIEKLQESKPADIDLSRLRAIEGQLGGMGMSILSGPNQSPNPTPEK